MEREQIKELLKKYSYNTVSYQSLMGGLSYFESSQGIEGFISYIKVDDVYIVAGDPICSMDNFMEFVHEFRKFCKDKDASCCFMSASSRARHNLEVMGFGSIKIGEEGIFDLNTYSFEGSKVKTARNSASHARKEGVVVRRLEELEEDQYNEIEELRLEWSTTRKVKGFSFLLSLDPLENLGDKIVFIAEYEDKLIGYLTCVPIYGKNGFYFEDLIRSMNAPYGINHLLVYEAISYLKSEGYDMATLGTSPLGNIEDMDNKEHPRINAVFKFIYNHLNGFYNFKGLMKFKASFNPTIWEGKYFCFYPPRLKPRIIIAIIKAYNPRGVPDLLFSKIKKMLVGLNDKF